MSRKKINDWIPEGEGIVFKNPVKIDKEDVGAFYGYDINWFYCNITPPHKYYGKMSPGITSFRIHSSDDYDPRATFDRAMPREEATKLCREFMRTIPRTGLTVEHFFDFFCKERGAGFDC